MSTIDELDLKTFITKKIVEESLTHEQLSTLLQEMFPNARGFSIRSLQRYCSKEEIHKTSRLNNADLNEAVLTSVMEVNIFSFVMHNNNYADMFGTDYVNAALRSLVSLKFCAVL